MKPKIVEIFYTVGNTESYDALLQDNKLFKGKGGGVWKTLKAVKFYRDRVWGDIPLISIYTLSGNWENDINPKTRNYGFLLKKIKILSKFKEND